MTELLVRPYEALHLCGLAVVPLSFLVPRSRHWKIFLPCLAVMLLVTGLLYHFSSVLPYGGLFPYCKGILVYSGTSWEGLVAGQHTILLTYGWRLAFTLLGCVGAADILAALVVMVRDRRFPGALLLFTLMQLLIILTLPFLMDRYLVTLFPGAIFLLVTMCGPNASSNLWAGVMAVALYGLVSIALFHDLLSWNSVRWQLGEAAIATNKIQPGDIEGGFEWNGWYASTDINRPMVSPGNAPVGSDDSLLLPLTRQYFPQVTGRFALAFTPPTNSVVVASLPYSLWLPPSQKEFFLVQEATKP